MTPKGLDGRGGSGQDHRGFAARRKAIQRIGLLQVRSYRLNHLAREEGAFQEHLDQKARVYPRMAPLMILRVMSNEGVAVDIT